MLNLYIAVKIIKGSLVLFAQIIIIAVNSRYDGTWHDDCGMWISPSEKLFLFVTQPAIELVQVASFVGIYLILSAAFLKPMQPKEGSCIGRFQLAPPFSEQEKRWHKCNPYDNIETLFYQNKLKLTLRFTSNGLPFVIPKHSFYRNIKTNKLHDSDQNQIDFSVLDMFHCVCGTISISSISSLYFFKLKCIFPKLYSYFCVGHVPLWVGSVHFFNFKFVFLQIQVCISSN